MTAPDTLAGQLLTSFARDGAAPRLTWYGADGERTELSGRVLANWVTKVTNLLVEEADAGPGTRVLLDLPVHWRHLVWSLAVWTAGAQIVLPGADEDDDDVATVVVTARPGTNPEEEGADLVLAVSLPALAMTWDGEPLPDGVVDAAAEVMSFGDVLGYVSEPEENDVALVAADLQASFGDLATWAAGTGELGAEDADDVDEDRSPVRALVSPGEPERLLEQALAVWQAGGSLVLAEPGTATARLDSIAHEENVDLRW